MDTEEIKGFVDMSQALAKVLENPDVLRFMEVAAQLKGNMPSVMPQRTDSLVYPAEVRSILRISNSTLQQYCKQGLLTPMYTPPKGRAKYWLSQVLAIPQP